MNSGFPSFSSLTRLRAGRPGHPARQHFLRAAQVAPAERLGVGPAEKRKKHTGGG